LFWLLSKTTVIPPLTYHNRFLDHLFSSELTLVSLYLSWQFQAEKILSGVSNKLLLA